MRQNGPPLSDEELKTLLADPKFSAQDRALLTPDEAKRLQSLQGGSGSKVLDGANSLVTGAAKGVGSTLFGLGNAVHSIPGIGNLTDMLSKAVGPAGTNPDTAFQTLPPELEGQNTMERVGKGAEQLLEFATPQGAIKKGITKGLVKMIPDAASPAMMRTLNKGAAYAGRIGGEGLGAGAISALHGNDNPETAAEVGAGGAATTEALAQLGSKLLTSKFGQRVLPVLLAGGVTQAIPGNLGFAAGIGTYGLAKKPIEQFLKQPGAQRTLANGMRTLSKGVLPVAEGLTDQNGTHRRRLAQ